MELNPRAGGNSRPVRNSSSRNSTLSSGSRNTITRWHSSLRSWRRNRSLKALAAPSATPSPAHSYRARWGRTSYPVSRCIDALKMGEHNRGRRIVMAEQKDDPGQTARSASAHAKKPSQVGGVAEDESSRTGDKTSATVVRRKQRYLIGFRSLPGIMSLPGDPFLERLAQMDGVEIIRRLPGLASMDPMNAATAVSSAPAVSSETVVVRMDEQRGEALRQNAPPHVIVEIDAPLDYSDIVVPEPLSGRLTVQAMPFPRPRRELQFRILGEGDRPLANAVINLYGPGFYGPGFYGPGIPAQAVTDSSGQASLQ